MDAQLETLLKQVADIQSAVALLAKTKGQVDGIPKGDWINKDQLERMKTDLLDAFDKKFAESRKPNDPEVGKPSGDSLNKFLSKVKMGDPALLKSAHMSEGTNADGGFSVPSGLDSKIFGAITDAATVVAKCTPYPHAQMDGFTKKIPRWLTGVTITNTAEAAVKATTKPTLDQPTSVLKKMTAIVVMTDELMQDNISSLDQKAAELIGRAMAIEQERQILMGDTGNSDPFMGIGYATGVNQVTQSAKNLTYSKLLELINYEMLEQYHIGAELYMRRSILTLIMGLVDGTNRPLWNMQSISGKMQNVVLGVPINISSQISKTLGTGSNESMILYGNYENVLLGFKEGGIGAGIAVSIATQGVISTGVEVTINLWTQDETGFRFVKRHSVVVIVPKAFTKMTGVK